MLIQRTILKKALTLLEWSPSITLLGARQIGKTTLANQLQKQLKKPSLYIDLENPDDQKKIAEATLFFEKNRDKCVIIDEIQRSPALFAWLRSIIDKHKVPARFILLGSASPVILKKATESLTGRTIYLELSGINFSEIHTSIPMEDHWFRGGFPKPLITEKDARRIVWYQSFLKNFIEIDLPQIGLSAPPLTLYRLITMIAYNNGLLWNASSLSKSLAIRSQTVANYRDFLEKTYLIRVLPPFFTNAKKKIVKSPKVYLRDPGLLHYIVKANDFNQLLGHPIVGYSWEGYVIEQIIAYVSMISDDLIEFSFYRTREGAEIDLVITRGIHPFIAIEMKMNSQPKTTRGLTSAIKDLGTAHNFIVVPKCDHPYPLKDNIEVTDLARLLKALKTLLVRP